MNFALSRMTKVGKIAASPAFIFGAAFATRLAAATFILHNYFGVDVLLAQNEPSHIAAGVVNGHGFCCPYASTLIAATAQQPPLYPTFLAVIFRVFGSYSAAAVWMAVLTNIVGGSLTAVLLYRIGCVYFSRTVGTLAAWVWVLPWMFGSLPLSTSLSSPYLAALGFAALLLLLPKAMRTGKGWFLLGIFAGLLVLLQPVFLAVLLLYAFWFAAYRSLGSRVLIAFVGLCLVVAPWTARNYVQFHRLIPLRDNFGLELWLGNRPGMHGTVDYSGDFPDHDPGTYARLGETRFMDLKYQEAVAFIGSSWIGFANRCLRRVFEFWYVPYSRCWIVVAIAGWYGALLAWKTSEMRVLLVAPLFTFPPVYYLTHMYATYRHPIDPLIILLACYAILELKIFIPPRFARAFVLPAPDQERR